MGNYTNGDDTGTSHIGDVSSSSLRSIFSRNLRYFRRLKNFSQEKLSITINMCSTYINGLENKFSFPQPEAIEAIAAALDIKAYQLFMEEGCPENVIYYDKETFISDVVTDISTTITKNIEDKIRSALKE